MWIAIWARILVRRALWTKLILGIRRHKACASPRTSARTHGRPHTGQRLPDRCRGRREHGHVGPYLASTNFGATSVGTLTIRRFLRPVCSQNMPEALLPEDSR